MILYIAFLLKFLFYTELTEFKRKREIYLNTLCVSTLLRVLCVKQF